ncbi:MAG: class I SAM-dependent methyltransferase [Candidatus Hodarchaeota archaeon]
MNRKIKIIRKLKSLFIKYKLSIPDSILFLCYLSQLSKWINQTKPLKFNNKIDLYNYLIKSEKLDEIYYLEFGVSEGHSFRWWTEQIKNRDSRFFGFDTFTGLPERFGVFPKGAMSTEGEIPKLNDSRCEFIKGLFQQTLPDFLNNWVHQTNIRKVIHLDADIYSATLFVLTTIAPFLNNDDILIFDEFSVPLHEFKAYSDFIKAYYIKTEIIGTANNYLQFAFKVKKESDER